MPGADLHLHSTASDGTDAPAVVCRRAKKVGLDTIALTDHDSVGGVQEARDTGREIGLEVIAGCELTAYRGEDEIHILGYGVDIESAELLEHLNAFREGRRDRLVRMLVQLADAGAPLEIDKVMAMASGDGAVGRVHVARALLDAGMSQGAALAFLVSGAGTSIGAIAGALTIARWRVVALVIGILWIGAILSGFVYDLLPTLMLF